MIQDTTFKNLSIVAVIGLLIILSLLILRPLAMAIATGLILAYIFHPVYKKILKVLREKNISALIIVLLCILIIMIPLWFLLPLLIRQVVDAYFFIQKINFIQILESLFPSFSQYSKDIAVSLNKFIADMTVNFVSSMTKTLLDIPALLLKIVVVFFIFFFGLRDGELLIEYIRSLSPFSPATEKNLIQKFKDITNAVIYGYVVVGVIQGILTGIGLFIFGIPRVLFFTIVSIFAAMIPFIGAWIVWMPAAIYLIIIGKTFEGVALFIYGSIIVSWIDNIIRPYIVAKRTKLSSAVVLVGMIGGLMLFGILGLIFGPLILAYLLVLLETYRKKDSASSPLIQDNS